MPEKQGTLFALSAFCVSEGIFLKKIREIYTGKLVAHSSSELLYETKNRGYICFLNYGTVVFVNISEAEQSATLNFLQDFLVNPAETKVQEDYEIRFGYPLRIMDKSIDIPQFSILALRVVILALAHTVTLDFYSQNADLLLAEVKKYAQEMETHGRLKIRKTRMKKFLGKILNSKNRIVENLYLFDRPELVWEAPLLQKIYDGLSRVFELRTRFREIEYTFRIIEDNVRMFNDLYMHRESSRLEWIIIILIAIEVLDKFFNKIFGK